MDECKLHSGIMSDIRSLQSSDTKQWDVIEKLRNRPPVWMSLAFAAALGALGWLIK